MATLLMDGGMISANELRETLFGKPNESHIKSLFWPGDAVRVKSYQQGVEWRRPHIRTPGYVYGVKGRVVDVCGKFGDPSFLAFGIECPKVWLYRVVRTQECFYPLFLPLLLLMLEPMRNLAFLRFVQLIVFGSIPFFRKSLCKIYGPNKVLQRTL